MKTNTKEIFKAVFSALWKYFLCFVLGALVMANCKGCGHEVSEPVKSKEDQAILMQIDSLQLQNEYHLNTIMILNKRVSIMDSISKIVRPAYHKTKKEGREFIQNNPCDSVGILAAYDLTVAKCDTVILVDSLKNVDLNSKNKQLDSVVTNMGSIIQMKEKRLTEKDIDLGIEKKKTKVQKRKTIVAVGLGILAVITTIFILK